MIFTYSVYSLFKPHRCCLHFYPKVDQHPILNNSCQDLSILKPGENLGTVLEDDLKSARLFISKLQVSLFQSMWLSIYSFTGWFSISSEDIS